MADYIIQKPGQDIESALAKAETAVQTISVNGTPATKDSSENVDLDLSNKVDKINTANKIYGTDVNGNQTSFDKDSFGQVEDVQVNNVTVVQNHIAKIDITGKLDKTSNPSKVYGTDANGNQTTFDKNSFGQVDDVQVNNVSIVQNKIAKIDLTGKQDALSQAQLNAVNSGITLSKVSQYDTDISNLKENLANYIDTFATKAALDAYSGTLTNNDWAIVLDDETQSHQCWRYIYKKSTLSWTPQFMINESPMTQEQIAALNSGINSTKVAQIETNKNDIANKQDKVTPITAQTDFKLGKVKFDTQGHITAFEEMHLYDHHFVVQYGDRVQYPNVTVTFKLTNTNQTAPTYSELASWLYNNGFTDKYKLYSASGVRTTITRYVASASGGTNTTSATIAEVADGLMSPDGEQILIVSNYGNQSNIGDGRAASPPSNLYNIYYVATTQIF